MKRILTTTAFLIVIVAIAAAAVYALNGASVAETAAAPAAMTGSASVESEVLAPAANPNWNTIALPLSVTGADTADDVAAYIDSTNNSIQKVAYWDAASSAWIVRTVNAPFGTPNFDVFTGDSLYIAADNLSPNILSWVGDVPDKGTIQHTLVQNKWNFFMIPLDQDGLFTMTADDLAADIGGVTKVAYWDATGPAWIVRTVNAPFGTPNFDVRIGYPYYILTDATAPGTWP